MKYETRVKRFHCGEYINASPEHPVVIDVPDGIKPDAELVPVTDGSAPPPPASRPAPDTFAPSELAAKPRKAHDRN